MKKAVSLIIPAMVILMASSYLYGQTSVEESPRAIEGDARRRMGIRAPGESGVGDPGRQ